MSQLTDVAIEVIKPPTEFCVPRWPGIEDGMGFAGEWLCTNYMLLVGIHFAFFNKKDIASLEQVMHEFRFMATRPHADQDAHFTEATSEMTTFQRQSTYHRNVLSWLNTGPMQRLWILRRIVSAQQ